jgi:TatD DNase family protein
VNEEAFLFPKMLYVCTRTEIMYTDSHTHLYLDAFSGDREEMVGRAVKAGVTRMLLPNIDSTTMQAVFSMAEHYPASCYPMMGLHPTSVKNDYLGELAKIEKALDDPRIVAIGETGIDLYRDKSHFREQVSSFKTQIGWAREMDLPLVIHARDSFSEIFDILEEAGTEGLRGVFHSFTGGPEELEKALSFGFMIGINGILQELGSGGGGQGGPGQPPPAGDRRPLSCPCTLQGQKEREQLSGPYCREGGRNS